MMSKDLTLVNFDMLERMLDPARFSTSMQTEIGIATKKNGLIAEGIIKQAIDAGKFASNSPMTIGIKGSARPLVNSGQLKKSISSQLGFWHTVFVGVVRGRRTARRGGSGDTLQVARILHDGATITVTTRMRKFFASMSRRAVGWKPLKASTTSITIPARPFLNVSVSVKAIAIYTKNWADAMQRAIGGTK